LEEKARSAPEGLLPTEPVPPPTPPPSSVAPPVAPPAAVTAEGLKKTDTGASRRPFYRRWYFWAGVSAVVIAAVAIGVAAGTSSSATTNFPGDTKGGVMTFFSPDHMTLQFRPR